MGAQLWNSQTGSSKNTIALDKSVKRFKTRGCIKLMYTDISYFCQVGRTPVYIAAWKGNLECLMVLIDAKADTNQARDVSYLNIFMKNYQLLS